MKCRYKKFETILKNYGTDWRNLEGVETALSGIDLRDISLPSDTELFQKIKGKSITGCKLPSMDYSNYNFDEVDIRFCTFGEKSILPSGTDLFQKIRYKSLEYCKLPSMDYSNYDFEGVDIGRCRFVENSILPLKTDLFQKIKSKSIKECKLPSMDYSNYNFNGVYIENCTFGEKTILPSDTELFQKIRNKSLSSCKLPSMDYSSYNFDDVYIWNSNLIGFICKDIQKYNLNQFKKLDFSSDEFNGLMSEEQANLIKLKYSERIVNGSLILPKIFKKDNIATSHDEII